ncbi:MAG: cellulase family glycosylhydrolase [Lachnospiraceae bacterium]|nr:cellulase family glycosylhydrolase [Lachnospiraceae bacterium]
MIGILYCSKSTLEYKKIESLLASKDIRTSCINMEEANSASFTGLRVLINAMDCYLPEEKITLLVDFFNAGGNIINLSPAPFTVALESGLENHRMLRSFGIIDDFRPIKEHNTFAVNAEGERIESTLTGLCSAVYHLSEKDHDGKAGRSAYLEHILDAFNEEGVQIATPVIRVVTHQKGSMSFFNFDFRASMTDEPFWEKLFLQLVQKELTGNLLLDLDCSFARYLPEEEKNIRIKIDNINYSGISKDAPLTLRIAVCDSKKHLIYEQQEVISLPYEATFTPSAATSSLYQVKATVSISDTVVTEKETGFLVLSEEELTRELGQFKPMYIDESISCDYCLVDGKPTAILGTTYFVSDVYRECFYYMNAWLCNQEMARLAADGFNTLRSGNWHYNANIYEADGSIDERGLRALQTYFFLAAKHGFTVQFALGNVMLNQWDEDRSPIHDSEMREKCMTFVRSFAQHFASYPNVTLDIVNEPSYSNKGPWTTARPSGETGELKRYRSWLSEKYNGNISALRTAWGESAANIQSFDHVEMPRYDLFSRNFCRTVQREHYVVLADFFSFAREEFLDWTAQVRANVKKYAPNMTVIMGRDETLRIPSQQDEVLAGNVDMVCWHQWHFNANLFTEYLLNRVRGKLCVAQELGMYKFDDVRSGKRHTDEEMAKKLQKKLLCAFGNFVQWQAHDDPFMYELCENSLGLYRADMSPTPSLGMTKKLIAAEKRMEHLMTGRADDKIKIATLYGTSYYFSVDSPVAQLGIRNHIYALYNSMKEQSDFVLEHLFKKEYASAIGSPRLIILPAMQLLRRDCWQELLEYAKNGATLLISGCIDKNEYFAEDAKISTLVSGYETRKLMDFEKLFIDGKEYSLDFRGAASYADASNVLDCGSIEERNELTEISLGEGHIIYCPYPIELSANPDAICALYEYAIRKAEAQNEIYKVIEGKPHILLTATSYENCTVYTLINEGYGDRVSFRDLRSGKQFTVSLDNIGGYKLWVSGDGTVLEQYGDDASFLL